MTNREILDRTTKELNAVLVKYGYPRTTPEELIGAGEVTMSFTTFLAICDEVENLRKKVTELTETTRLNDL